MKWRRIKVSKNLQMFLPFGHLWIVIACHLVSNIFLEQSPMDKVGFTIYLSFPTGYNKIHSIWIVHRSLISSQYVGAWNLRYYLWSRKFWQKDRPTIQGLEVDPVKLPKTSRSWAHVKLKFHYQVGCIILWSWALVYFGLKCLTKLDIVGGSLKVGFRSQLNNGA